MAGKHFILKECLTTCATGGGGIGSEFAVKTAGGYGNCLEFSLRIAGMGVVAGGTLGAGARGESYILLV